LFLFFGNVLGMALNQGSKTCDAIAKQHMRSQVRLRFKAKL